MRLKTVLSFGGLAELGWFEIFLITLLLVFFGVSISAWRYVSQNVSQKSTREAYGIIVGRDLENISRTLLNSLKELEDAEGLQNLSRSAKVSLLVKRMKETIIKMKKYIGEGVKKIK